MVLEHAKFFLFVLHKFHTYITSQIFFLFFMIS